MAQGKEISLDLGGFKQSKQSIEHLLSMANPNPEGNVKSMNAKVQKQPEAPTFCVEFETTLSFVDIPVPDLPRVKAETVGVAIRDETKRILNWLRDEKGVTGIYELRVRDSLYLPHCEETIKSCLDNFDIEILDWMRVDLSLEPIKDTCRNLKELTLYGSTWSSLQSWTSEEVKGVFDKFCKVCLAVFLPH
jgi:hypothetical protein